VDTASRAIIEFMSSVLVLARGLESYQMTEEQSLGAVIDQCASTLVAITRGIVARHATVSAKVDGPVMSYSEITDRLLSKVMPIIRDDARCHVSLQEDAHGELMTLLEYGDDCLPGADESSDVVPESVHSVAGNTANSESIGAETSAASAKDILQ
jgi:hypothetical protein